MVADLDQAAQPVAGQVGADRVPVVAVIGGHDVEPGAQLLTAGQGEQPGSGFALGEVPGAGRRPGARLGRPDQLDSLGF